MESVFWPQQQAGQPHWHNLCNNATYTHTPLLSALSCQTWFASVGAQVSAKTLLCKSKRLTCFAHCTPTYPALLFRTACDSDNADWFLTLVLTRLSRFACEIGPICVGRAAPNVIRLRSMDFGIFASADRRRRRRRHARQDTICATIS